MNHFFFYKAFYIYPSEGNLITKHWIYVWLLNSKYDSKLQYSVQRQTLTAKTFGYMTLFVYLVFNSSQSATVVLSIAKYRLL